jgi:two-component system, chemotaxis family, CheB/CheR fusion protein
MKKKISTKRHAAKKLSDSQQSAKKRIAGKPVKQKKEGIKSFPVVGIGGSAGGIEAFSELLQHLPDNLGMAYVYIQHLSTSHDSFLPEILQRKTKMKVHEVKNNMPLVKDNVYVIPAKYFITVQDSKLKLLNRPKEQTPHAIDYFLTSLAPLYQQNAIGVLLSGMGTDGTLGLMAVKAEGGITFAQDISASYQGMPHHAVEMGYVDFVMPPDKIAKELASLIRQPYAVTSQNEFLQANKDELRKIHMIMNSKRGVDFSHYKQTTIHRRIMRRMALHHIKDFDAYALMLKENKAEVDALYQDLLITVTNFFRDPSVYNALTNKILPVLLKNRKPNDPLRIWIPGCATGEEAVSFAIVLLEYLGEAALTIPIQVFATDLNEKAIEKARASIYLKSALQNVSPQRLRRFFIKVNDHYQVVKAIRDMCIFAPHNLLKDPPFSRMDIISCQNVLIYLESLPQNKIMHTFHYALKPTGYLLLGKSETIGSAIDLFEQSSREYKIYIKKLINTPIQLDFRMRSYPAIETLEDNAKSSATVMKEPDLDKETDKMLLTRYVPASVLVNKDLEILRFRGSTSRYLEPSSGKASLHLLKMIKEELVFDLRTVIHRAKVEGRAARKEGIIFSNNGSSYEIVIEVMPIRGQGKDYYLIVFKEEGEPPVSAAEPKVNWPGNKTRNALEKKIVSLETQLKEARDSIRIITEDFEATREELQSANEEVLSSNEELQSINEELETSKEELQSTNEELTTINEELQLRNSELKEAGDYTKAVIETMHESLIMLDSGLKVKNANKGFYKTFMSTPEETEGTYLYDLGNSQWDIPELKRQLKMLQSRNIPFADLEVTHDFPVIGHKIMLLNAHKVPMREGGESLILLAIQDITSRKRIEETLKENEEHFRLLVQNALDIITVFDQDGTIKFESPAIEPILGYTAEERIGRNINMDPIVHPDDKEAKIRMLKKAITSPGQNIFGEFRLRHKNGSYRTIEAIFRNLLDNKKINGIIANYRDVTDRKILEQQKDEFIGIASHELKTPVTSIKAYAQILEQNFQKAKDRESEELLHKMNNQIDRLNTLIVDLLDFTRIEGGKLKFREEDYNLNDLLNEVVEEMQRTTRQHTIIKKFDKAARLWGDRYRTGQVVTNLMNNAIKYSPGAKKIIVSSEVKSGNVIVCIQDFGIGIDNEYIDKVFDRFFRASESSLNTFSGLGLGLYIASEIIKRQEGRIWVKSTKGKSSTFCFSLPLKRKKLNHLL